MYFKQLNLVLNDCLHRGLKTIDRNDLKPQLISGEGKRARLMDTIGVTRGLGDHDIEFLYAPGLKIKPFMLPNPEVSSLKFCFAVVHMKV